ncbi:MAG TPA: hypothetical protein VFM82_10815 [Flavobacteriaceae bacterium]|nr:hypothetical protein [Flavobacteriaceae bacterium]
MKKSMTILIAFFALSLTSAQEKIVTVEEIYANYIEAIGGSEKLDKVVNKKEIRSISNDYEITGQSAEKGAYKEEDIGLIDSEEHLVAYITRYITNKGDTLLSRQLQANGKSTTWLPNGEKKEKKIVVDKFKEGGCFPSTIIPAGSEILPNEIFNEKEVYVVHLKKRISNDEWHVYTYFDMNSGFVIGEKTVGANDAMATSYLRTIEYGDYKEVEGIFIPHTRKMYEKSVSSHGISTIIKNKTTQVIAVEFNTDIKDFKNNCFKKPEECFEKAIK